MRRWPASSRHTRIEGDEIEIRDARDLPALRRASGIERYLAAEAFLEADAPEIVAEAERATAGLLVPIGLEGRRVLDLGCGPGRWIRAVERRGAWAVGLDLSWELLDLARQAGSRRLVRADMRSLPFADSSFYLVLCMFTTFGYFATADDDRRALGEMARVLRVGGSLVLGQLNAFRARRDLVPYPFLPSGNTIISDINTGLYVLKFNGSVPVELSSFTAEVISGIVNLKWSTSSEKNNQGFELQRKVDDEFSTIGFVEGNGTSTEINNYTFIDRDAKSGNYYYRLKQIDFDGSSNYSDEIFVEITSPADFVLEQNFPNPFNPATTIRFNLPTTDFVNISVYNLVGEKVSELINAEFQQGEHNLIFNAFELPSGVYIAKLSGGNFNQSIRMTLLK